MNDFFVRNKKRFEKAQRLESYVNNRKSEEEALSLVESAEVTASKKFLSETSKGRVKRLERLKSISESAVQGQKVLEEYGSKFGALVFKAVPLDEDFKAEHEDTIVNVAKDFLIESVRSGLVPVTSFTTNKSPLVNEIFSETKEGTASAEMAGDEVEEVIRDKVKDVLASEKELARLNSDEEEELKSLDEDCDDDDDEDDDDLDDYEEMYGDEDDMDDLDESKKPSKKSAHRTRKGLRETQTLFRALVIANSKNELLVEDGKVITSKVVAESIIQYTLLETLNTMNLVTFNTQAARDIANSFISNK